MEHTGKKLIVVKIGSSSLTDSKGSMDSDKIKNIVSQVAKLKDQGHKVILVTSGSISAGFRLLGYNERPKTIAAKQASASVGQGLLMEEYTKYFNDYGYVTAQILLTRGDFSDKRRYKNIVNTLDILLKRGAIPIINENDTVSIEELKIGDNDTLSAQVAAMVHADLLILLTDIDGLYSEDPRKNPEAKKIEVVEEITKEIEAIAGSAGSSIGTGGMRSKISAGKIAVASGVPMLITHSGKENILLRVSEGDLDGSYFLAKDRKLNTRLQWMSFYSLAKGSITVDEGAANALEFGGKSLLPTGITKINGDFKPGDVVEVFNAAKKLIGKGIINYSSQELEQLKGMSTQEIFKQTGKKKAEAIHRDNWVGSSKKRKEGI